MTMYQYEYFDKQLNMVVFQCKANTFDDADVLFKKETGADYHKIKKTSYLTCYISLPESKSKLISKSKWLRNEDNKPKWRWW